MRQSFHTRFLSLFILAIFASCQEEIEVESVNVEHSTFVRISSDINVPGNGPTITLYCRSRSSEKDAPLIILVKNGKESILEGSLSDVNLQEVERFEVIRSPQLPEKLKVHGKDAIKLYFKE